ncbi:thioesterase family protein [Ruminiclostridium cellobioparum]|uniref:Putative thioesterase n=1 Tax=Ruminiclostridium cellobioparum subsp. termitidis CT1112 TaxID=1195236 RepID=S0FKP2_RUMCE|nr:thioesterase family protein [Ruminiclostridium cellobioparum]EMS72432.1 putative thioesterase [Ruminiclostridium cellobioparum subsp. termitidis CT1112]
MEFTIGLTGEASVPVDGSNTAETMGSGELEVFATPSMIALMEKAATNALKGFMPADSSSVGTMINVKHSAATPMGMKVTAKAVLTEVDGKRLVFTVGAFDEKEKIGEGMHERFIINIDRFMAKTNGKIL